MKISFIKGNLFTAPQQYILAHCISKDAKMGAGIATLFRDKSSGVQYSLSMNNHNQIGNVIPYHLKDGRKYYNLITKSKYWNKPTFRSLTMALIDLRKQMLLNNEKFLAIPKIGSGLDRLDWKKVKQIIELVFLKTSIEIVIYSLD
ncbi:MAG: macro domain-containing protein [Liquorilactobacillus hordei]|uniref:macro domain-containing protein n=1 Tax=Liquorilactobacillus hordei TaxID=468911 RepID=UPI0039EB8715